MFALKLLSFSILQSILFRSFSIIDFSQQKPICIYIDKVWIFRRAECKIILRSSIYPHFFSSYFSVFMDIYGKRELKILVLSLVNRYHSLFFHWFVRIFYIQFRVSAVKIPLIKEPVKVFSRNFFQRKSQLVCLSCSVFIGFQIVRKSFKERFITEIISQHVKNSASFVIRHAVKHILTALIIKSHQMFVIIQRIMNICRNIIH